jgi:putative ABC transport system substrate-binding protein
MKKRIVLSFLAASASLSLGACQKSNTLTIGVLQLVTATPLNMVEKNFEETLKASSWAEGKDLAFDVENPEAKDATMASMASQLVSKSDLILTIATNASLSVKNAIAGSDREIPQVFSACTDPVGSKIVSQIEAGRSENITGVSDRGPVAKLIDDVIDNFSGVSGFESQKIAVMYNPKESNSLVQIGEAEAEIEKKGWSFEAKTVTESKEIYTVASSITAPALYYPTDNLLTSGKAEIAKAAEEKKLVVACGDPSTLEADASTNSQAAALIGRGVDYNEIGVLAAKQALAILSGEQKASEIAVGYVDKNPLIVNKTLAASWGIALPDSLLNSADTVL